MSRRRWSVAVASVALTACFGGSTRPAPAPPDDPAAIAAVPSMATAEPPAPQGWTCFADAAGRSACDFTAAKCARRRATVAEAYPCEAAASVWCYDTEATDVEPAHRACVKLESECSLAKPSGAVCAEEHETPMQRFDRLEAQRDELEAQIAAVQRSGYSCFDFFSTAIHARFEVCEVTADCAAKRDQTIQSGLAVGGSDCALAPSVWCFTDNATTCLPSEESCQQRRATLLAGRLGADNECAERP